MCICLIGEWVILINFFYFSSDWVDCWSVPIVALSILYVYHPTPPFVNSNLDLDITTPEKEEILLSPIRPNGFQNSRKKMCSSKQEFDPLSLSPDIIHLELEIGPSVIKLYGSLLRSLIQLKVTFKKDLIQISFHQLILYIIKLHKKLIFSLYVLSF